MADRRFGSFLIGAGLVAAVAWPACLLLLQRWHVRRGTSDDEFARAMPGDDIVKGTRDVSTRVVTIRARPQAIWPWLVQMGYQRGGMYSYDGIDRLLDRTLIPASLR